MSATVRAGDFSTLNFIGFSRDGRYLAFEEYGVTDPDGIGYSTTVFVDTLKNTIVGKPISFLKADLRVNVASPSYESSARKLARAAIVSMTQKLGIVAGNTGREVISRPLTDVSVENSDFAQPKAVTFAPNRRERWLNGRFKVELKAFPTEQFCKPADDLELVKVVDPFDNELPLAVNPHRKTKNADKQRIYGLELAVIDDDQDTSKILQKDFNVSLVRGCSIDYRINVYKDFIAVFVGMIKPGWAGDSIRMMVVTGKYRNEQAETWDAP